MTVQKILDSDTLKTGFRTKYNETVDEIPVSFTDNGDGTGKLNKGSGSLTIDFTGSFPKKSETCTTTEAGNISAAAITALKDNVPDAGNTLNKLYSLITALQSLVSSDDISLDTVQEIVTFIKNNKDVIDSISTNKVNISDIVDNLLSTDTNRPLSANQGYVIKGLIDALTATVGNKVDKVDGKGLSTNDYSTEEKNKLASLGIVYKTFSQADLNTDYQLLFNHAKSTQKIIAKLYDNSGTEQLTAGIFQKVDKDNVTLSLGNEITGTWELILEYWT